MKKIKARWIPLLRAMVRDRRLSPIERLATRVGYMGVGFLIMGQWTLIPACFIAGFICVMIQVAVRRQWKPSAITTQWVDSMDHTLHKLFIIKKAPIKGLILFTSVFTFLHTSTRLSFLSYCLTFSLHNPFCYAQL